MAFIHYLHDLGIINSLPTEIAEPIGFDDIEFTLRKSQDLGGMEFAFSDNIQFYIGVAGLAGGADIVRQAYNRDGIDAQVLYHISESGCNHYFSRRLNFAVYKEEEYCADPNDKQLSGLDDCSSGIISVGLMPLGFAQTFRNRLDVSVSLDADKGLDGETMSNNPPVEIKLHSKEILFESKYKINSELKEVETAGKNDGVLALSLVPPFQAQLTELEGSLEPFAYTPVQDYPYFYSGLTLAAGINFRDVKIKIRTRLNLTARSKGGFFMVVCSIQNAEFEQVSEEIIFSQAFPSNQTTAIDTGDIERLLSVPVNYNVYLYNTISTTNELLNGLYVDALLSYDDTSSYILLSENSTITPSVTKSYFIFEAFKSIIENLTGVTSSFESDFFESGCGDLIAITNGKNLRQLRDKEGNLFPINCSYKQLFDACNAVFCLGQRVELREDGSFYVRVEPRAYFYQQQMIKTFPFVTINRSVNLEHIYNEFECGYSKWETGQTNGLDEFNSKRNYLLPVKSVKKKLSAICSFIAGGYLIEQTRRQQFKENPTKDFATDDDLFFICTNRETVNSSIYELNADNTPKQATYPVGSVSERNEQFPGTENIISPSTAYNLRLKPSNIARYYARLLAVSLYSKENAVIKFLTGSGNYQMRSNQSGLCRLSQLQLAEDGDLTALDSEIDNPLFAPETLEFTAPMHLNDFLDLAGQSVKQIGVSCSNENFLAAYLENVTYKPLKDGGTGDFQTSRG